jgi:hypothetical protein
VGEGAHTSESLTLHVTKGLVTCGDHQSERTAQLAANRAVAAEAVEAGYGTRDMTALAELLRRGTG